MGTSGADEGKPKGWHGKAARQERQAAREQRRAERAERTKASPTIEALRAGAQRRLARLPSPTTSDGPSIVSQATERETERVARILARDRSDARRGRLHATACVEVAAAVKRTLAGEKLEKGESFANLADTVLAPTPEQLRAAEYRPVLIEKLPGSVRTAETVRRVTVDRVKQLYARGVFSDDTYPAVLWYRRQWEAAQMGGAAGVSQYGERMGGSAVFHARLPRSAAAAEAWENYWLGRRAIKADMLATFEKVVLEEMSVADAARAARCRFINIDVMLQAAALLLLGGIAHLLPVRAGDGQEIVPADDAAFVTELEPGRDVDPIMLDARGMFRAADDLAAIVRGRALGLGDTEILGLLDGELGA